MKVQIGDKTYNVPDGTAVKVFEEANKPEPKRKFKAGDYAEYEGVVYLITELTDRGYKVKEVSAPVNYHWETIELGFINEPKMKLRPGYEEIIDKWGDAHDPELRRKINDAWNKNREGFCPILRALYARDIDEITDHNAFWYPDWENTPEYKIGRETGVWRAYNSMAYEHMCLEWDFYAENYLSHIADDSDLECILNFLHYPYLPVYKD